MDAGKIHNLINEVERRRVSGLHVDVETRKLVEELRTKPFLDRVDLAVFVLYPHMTKPVWEHFEGVSSYEVTDGVLSVLVGGNDADGDWGSVRALCWPKGVWLKMETELTPIDNPYHEPPQVESSDDAFE